MSRTGLDFSKHEILITQSDGLLVHFLKQPGTYTNCIKFINTNDIMAVTGDFGNWIFCREFHPSPEGRVSDGYWVEKLRNSSEQKGQEYDEEATEAEINRMLNGGIEEYGYDGKQAEEYREYLEECLNLCDDEFGYSHYAYREHPSFMDSESVIFCQKSPIWLQIIFDGFDYMCAKMKEELLEQVH